MGFISWKYPRVRGEELSPSCASTQPWEIPPRARGRVSGSFLISFLAGNTPACAGKSDRREAPAGRPRKYPRVRGEEASYGIASLESREIPPRARGRVAGHLPVLWCAGNTPACAGKSIFSNGLVVWARKYPRVRGEERVWASPGRTNTEIPPRARGRDIRAQPLIRRHGNTPACAGKSHYPARQQQCCRKYPRVRGEEQLRPCIHPNTREIPPRARGRAPYVLTVALPTGNTPACAGKSASGFPSRMPPRKYPRVRGEETVMVWSSACHSEIPPRARGRVKRRRSGHERPGNTPACAGKRRQGLPDRRHHRKYPRVRGEESK